MKAWFKLLFCIVLIWCFVELVPLVLNKSSSYENVIQKSESLDIDNAALFYSEEALTSDAELELRQRLSTAEE